MLKRFYPKTVVCIVLVVLCITGLHMYNHLEIQAIRYTEEWGKGIPIGTGHFNRQPLISLLDEGLLIASFNSEGKLNYYLCEEDGNVIKSGVSSISNLDPNKIKNIALIGNNLLYQVSSELYRTSFSKDKGLSESELLLDNIDGFRTSIIKGRASLQTFNKEEISIYDISEPYLQEKDSFTNKWDILDVYLRELKGKEYIFISYKADEVGEEFEGGSILDLEKNQAKVSDEIIGGTIEDMNKNELKLVDKIVHSSDEFIYNIYIEPVEDNFIIGYPIIEIKDGSRNEYVKLKVVSSQDMSIEGDNKLDRNSIVSVEDMGREMYMISDRGKLKLLGSALNYKNIYASYRDVFVTEIDKMGNPLETTFLAYTENNSKNPVLINGASGTYLAWLDVEGKEYKLMLNSTNDDFKVTNYNYTKEEYKSAFLKALTSPFYAFAFFIIKGSLVLLYISVAFLIAGFTLYKLNIRSNKIRICIFIAIYILVNLITFKGIFYAGDGVSYMPEILRLGLSPYLVPLVINLISGLILYVFHKERKYVDYFPYVALFVLVDIYVANLLYMPFTMIKNIIV